MAMYWRNLTVDSLLVPSIEYRICMCMQVDRILANNVVYEKEKGERPEELQCAFKCFITSSLP